MPPPKHRKKPFSAKLKKEQLKAKREKKRFEGDRPSQHKHRGPEREDTDSEDDVASLDEDVKKVNQQPTFKGDKYDPNRYRLHFLVDSPAELERRTTETRSPYSNLPEEALEVDLDDIYRPGTVLDVPKRPKWDYNMSKSALNSREEDYFKGYLDSIMAKHKPVELSYFELNLETWRQLWRVLEMADVVLLITDIRHPALHFSPAFYNFVTKDLQKPLILVLNKIDLAPPPLVVAWKRYFESKFPQLHVVYYTLYPKDTSEEDDLDPGKVLHKRRKRKAYSAVGPKQLLEACQKIVGDKVDLGSWREKIEGEIEGVDTDHETRVHMEEIKDGGQHVPYRDGVLTIGCCGYPNVGKSSLMNGLMGKKVVSVSRTPGHTKHFQTIYLTPTVKLCDSPGLVFPSLVAKPMQILAGIYPIAQVREPYSAVQYLAERLALPQLLRIKHPEDEDGTESSRHKWTAFWICDAWAEKRGFLTAKAARNDVYRAANHLLRMAVEGRLCMCTRPPGYTKQKADWENDLETQEVSKIQSLHQPQQPPTTDLDLQHQDFDTDDKDYDEYEGSSTESDDSTGGKKAGPSRTKPLTMSNPFALLEDDDD